MGRVFLSYRSSDRVHALRIEERLRQMGFQVFLDSRSLVAGQDWRPALERELDQCDAVVVLVGPDGLGNWQQREVTLAMERQHREAGFPLVPVLLDGADPPLGFLRLSTWVDLRRRDQQEAGFQLLALGIRREPPGDLREHVRRAQGEVCPYRGLRAYREEDEAFFFGRDAVTEELVATVRAQRLVVVVGQSGTGKSSVARCGLVSRLRRDRDGAWEFLTLVPSFRPLASLARCLLERIGPDLSEADLTEKSATWSRQLRDKTLTLRGLLDDVLRAQPGTSRVLLLVDQGEEVFTQCQDEAERQRFLDELRAVAEDERFRVVVTIRSDFHYGGLDQRWRDLPRECLVPVGAMAEAEVREVIVSPAREVGLDVSDALVNTMVKDVGVEPGRLPLLQYVLEQMWRERAGQVLDDATYDAVGRVDGAIGRRAEKVFQDFQGQQETLAWLFLQLVTPGEGAKDTRQRAHFHDAGDAAREIVRRLADERLLVTGSDGAGQETVEIGHEALLTSWPWLVDLVRDNRGLLVWRRHTRQQVLEYSRTGSRDWLLRGRFLAEVMESRSGWQQFLTRAEQRLVQASVRARRSARALAGAGVAAVLVFAVVIGVLWWQGQQANRRLVLQTLGWRLEQCQAALRQEFPGSSVHAAELRYGLQLADELLTDLLPKAKAERDALVGAAVAGGANPDPVRTALRTSLDKACADIEAWAQETEGKRQRIQDRLTWIEGPGAATLAQYDRAWEEAKQALADPGGAGPPALPPVRPMPGLVPIGLVPRRDVQGEFELEKVYCFAHLASGLDGEAPMPEMDMLRKWASAPGSGGIVLVLIPGGSCVLGENEKAPPTEVQPFLMAMTEVTEAQWRRFRSPPEWAANVERAPIRIVNWYDAAEFCAWAGLRLPSESEWEYACRAQRDGERTEFWCGDQSRLRMVAWFDVIAMRGASAAFDAQARHEVLEVGQKPANPFGLVDVHGNVREWCKDEVVIAGSAWRVMRGGSWREDAMWCRSAYRLRLHPGHRDELGGFRPASSLP